MEDKLAIKLKIIERFYPLRIDVKDEEKLRNAAIKINETVMKYKTRYPEKDDQDLLAMASLQFVTRMLELETSRDTEAQNDGVQMIVRELDELIREIQ